MFVFSDPSCSRPLKTLVQDTGKTSRMMVSVGQTVIFSKCQATQELLNFFCSLTDRMNAYAPTFSQHSTTLISVMECKNVLYHLVYTALIFLVIVSSSIRIDRQ